VATGLRLAPVVGVVLVGPFTGAKDCSDQETYMRLICIQELNEILARQVLQSLARAKTCLCASKDCHVNLPCPSPQSAVIVRLGKIIGPRITVFVLQRIVNRLEALLCREQLN